MRIPETVIYLKNRFWIEGDETRIAKRYKHNKKSFTKKPYTLTDITKFMAEDKVEDCIEGVTVLLIIYDLYSDRYCEWLRENDWECEYLG